MIAVRHYRWLLRLLTGGVDADEREAMAWTFATLYADARTVRHRLRVVLVSRGGLPGLLVREWRDHPARGDGRPAGLVRGTGVSPFRGLPREPRSAVRQSRAAHGRGHRCPHDAGPDPLPDAPRSRLPLRRSVERARFDSRARRAALVATLASLLPVLRATRIQLTRVPSAE